MAAFSELQVSFWMDKAVKWGQATCPAAQQDISRSQGPLRSFLQQLLHTLHLKDSTSEAMESLPFVGQFLGRLCWNPYVTADGESCSLLVQCVCRLYSTEPQNAVEQRANDWIRLQPVLSRASLALRLTHIRAKTVLTDSTPNCLDLLHVRTLVWSLSAQRASPEQENLLFHLTSEEEGSETYALERLSGSAPKHYSSDALQKMVALLAKEVSASCSPSGDNLESIHAVSVACVPLVTYPEAGPLIGALLNRPLSCGFSHLSEEFIEAVSTALLNKKLVVDDTAVMALWCHSLSSLEGAVLSMLEWVLSDPGAEMQRLEEAVSDSLLPKASALHCRIFLVVNDVFRNVLMSMEENVSIRVLIQVFTSCFLQTRTAQSPQERLPLRAFFLHVPHNLLTPLLTQPSEVPRQAWLEHVAWISRLLPSMPQDSDQGGGDSPRALFEAWFLLVQCGQWVDVSAELLVSVEPEQSEPLLQLLTFYHHPTSRGHQSAQQIMAAKEVWGHLRILFLAHTLRSERLSAVNELMSSVRSAHLPLHLLLSFAIFSPASPSTAVEVLLKVLTQAKLKRRGVWFLASSWCRLNGGGPLDATLHSRLRTLQDGLLPEHVSRHT